MLKQMADKVVWCFGRGLSIGCGLTWDVPAEWRGVPREEKVEKIRKALLDEMIAPRVSVGGIKVFLTDLARMTEPPWRHLFVTTNWDYLLQRELLAFIPNKTVPRWLTKSWVYHLNGTVEEPWDCPDRSPFLLVEDPHTQRTLSREANDALTYFQTASHFVVVGMSFECSTDRFFLHQLCKLGGDFPVGESEWLVVNPNHVNLANVCRRIEKALPDARVDGVWHTLDEWRGEGFREMRPWGVFGPQ